MIHLVIASLVTIISLIIAPVIYFVKKWYDVSSENFRASENISRELDDALTGLNARKQPGDLRQVILSDDHTVIFMNRALNHDFYESDLLGKDKLSKTRNV